MNYIVRVIIFTLLYNLNTSLSCGQIVHDLLYKVKLEVNNNNYYSVLNSCREILRICSEEPVSECSFTNVMKDVYYYKGTAEFEIYKKELKLARLESAMISFEQSYQLFKDANVLFSHGYLLAIHSLLLKSVADLEGLVKAWQGILELYSRDGWVMNRLLLEKIKDYIQIAEKFATLEDHSNYSGTFARFMISLASDLAQKGQLESDDRLFFDKYKKKSF